MGSGSASRSGGQLCASRKIFLFDEPLSNLDAELRVAMRSEITDLHARLGNTMIYVTHDQVEAMTMADKIAVLRKGVVEQFGRPLDLFNAPCNRFVAGVYWLARDELRGRGGAGGTRLRSTVVRLWPSRRILLTWLRGKRSPLAFAPLTSRCKTGGALDMHVRKVEQLGAESYVYGALEDGTPITLHQLGQVDVTEGTHISIDPTAGMMHLFDTGSGLSLRR